VGETPGYYLARFQRSETKHPQNPLRSGNLKPENRIDACHPLITVAILLTHFNGISSSI
jgi:hypothetical protein